MNVNENVLCTKRTMMVIVRYIRDSCSWWRWQVFAAVVRIIRIEKREEKERFIARRG